MEIVFLKKKFQPKSAHGSQKLTHIGSASYWKQKYEDHTFHSDSHGGLRFTKFTEGEFQAINEILWNQCQRKPTTRLGE